MCALYLDWDHQIPTPAQPNYTKIHMMPLVGTGCPDFTFCLTSPPDLPRLLPHRLAGLAAGGHDGAIANGRHHGAHLTTGVGRHHGWGTTEG